MIVIFIIGFIIGGLVAYFILKSKIKSTQDSYNNLLDKLSKLERLQKAYDKQLKANVDRIIELLNRPKNPFQL